MVGSTNVGKISYAWNGSIFVRSRVSIFRSQGLATLIPELANMRHVSAQIANNLKLESE